MIVNMSTIADIIFANTGVNKCSEKSQANHREQQPKSPSQIPVVEEQNTESQCSDRGPKYKQERRNRNQPEFAISVTLPTQLLEAFVSTIAIITAELFYCTKIAQIEIIQLFTAYDGATNRRYCACGSLTTYLLCFNWNNIILILFITINFLIILLYSLLRFNLIVFERL